jgi:hypothetical protein
MTNIETTTKTNYYFKELAWLATRLSAMMTLARPASAGFDEASSKIVSPEVVAQAVRAAARRLEAEGIQELVMLHFYGNPRSTEVGALLTFSDRERMIEHIEMISGWEEFERFFATVMPVDVRVYGELSAKAEEWIGQFDVLSKKFEEHVAGFVR